MNRSSCHSSSFTITFINKTISESESFSLLPILSPLFIMLVTKVSFYYVYYFNLLLYFIILIIQIVLQYYNKISILDICFTIHFLTSPAFLINLHQVLGLHPQTFEQPYDIFLDIITCRFFIPMIINLLTYIH